MDTTFHPATRSTKMSSILSRARRGSLIQSAEQSFSDLGYNKYTTVSSISGVCNADVSVKTHFNPLLNIRSVTDLQPRSLKPTYVLADCIIVITPPLQNQK